MTRAAKRMTAAVSEPGLRETGVAGHSDRSRRGGRMLDR